MNTIQSMISRAETQALRAQRSKPIASVAISSRWKPGHVIHINTAAGTYEEVNPPRVTHAEADVQLALLDGDQRGYHWTFWAVCALAAVCAIAIPLLDKAPA